MEKVRKHSASFCLLEFILYEKKSTATLICFVSKLRSFFGGGEEIRTLAPAKPTYRISNPDPSTTWVHLHRTQTGPGLSPRRKKPQADGGASVSDTRQTIRAEDSLIKDTKKAERNQEGRGKK